MARTSIASSAISARFKKKTIRMLVPPRAPATNGLAAMPTSDALVNTPNAVPCAPAGITHESLFHRNQLRPISRRVLDVVVRAREQHVTILVVDLAQGDGLQRALEKLLADRALLSRFGANGRARVVSQFSWEKVARSYVSLFGKNGAAPV